MRKSLAIAGVLMIGLSVSGASCVTNSGGSGGIATSEPPVTRSAVGAAILKYCSYVVPGTTLAKVIAAVAGGSSGIINSVGAIAQAACDAATNNPLADGPGDHTPVVAGVKLKGGHFVR